MAED
jgi:radial spoke head protein 1